jgi:protein TonB
MNFSLILIFFAAVNVIIRVVITPIHVKPGPVIVEGDIKPPKVIKKVEPIYPEEARKAGMKGEVILEVYADGDGKLQTVKVLNIEPLFKAGSKIGLLYKGARDALKQWEFEPMIIDGFPRSAIFTVTVKFE